MNFALKTMDQSLDGAGNEMLLALQEIVENLIPLGVAYFLQNHLLCCLCAYPPEIDRLQRFFEVIANLNLGILFLRFRERNVLGFEYEIRVSDNLPTAKGFKITGFAINHNTHIRVIVNPLLGC